MFPYVAAWGEWKYAEPWRWPRYRWFWDHMSGRELGGRLELDGNGRAMAVVRCWGERIHWPWVVTVNTALLLAGGWLLAVAVRSARRRRAATTSLAASIHAGAQW